MVKNSLSPESRVWIYQSNQTFPKEKVPFLQQQVKAFCKQWVSHNNALKADGEIYHDRFVVLMVDESQAGASGCSIDTSVRFIQAIEQEFGVQMFDRMLFSYEGDNGVETVSNEEFSKRYQAGIITDDTLVFDNMVNTLGKLEREWKKPLKASWHARFV